MQCKRERIREKFEVKKICLNYSVQEIRETAYAHSSIRRPERFHIQQAGSKLPSLANKPDSQPFRKAFVPT
jgi:hypothetical protein